MTIASAALDASGPRAPSWLTLLRAELAPTPGRFNAVIRLVVGTIIVLVTSMTLQVPSVALSLLIVIYLTILSPGSGIQSSVAVTIASIAAVVVLTLAIALTLVIFKLTVDYPPLRLAAMALAFFLGMFAFRVFAAPAVGFIIAMVVLVTQSAVDLVAGPETFVRAVLWVWVAIAYPAAVAVGVNLLLLPADPEPLLRRAVAARLRAAAQALAAQPGTPEARKAAAALATFAEQGPEPLLKLLHLAQIRTPAIAPLHAERTAKLLLVQRLVESIALLADLTAEPSPEERTRLASAALECERLAEAVSTGVQTLPAVPMNDRYGDSRSALAPVLAEIEHIVRELPAAERPEGDEPHRNARLFVPDALTNPRHVQFALKATMAAMLCYIAYTAVDWPGVHTCMITCAVVALGTAGQTIHKATLRLIGCALAGALALASIVFVLPHMTSIAGLALLVAAVTLPAAWIATGSERIAYVGMQLAFTFYLAVLQGFGPTADVTEFRDRFVGIVFGVVVMALVFTYVWPERAGTGMVQSLVAALRRMAELARRSGDAAAPRAAAWKGLEEADRLGWVAGFEPNVLGSAEETDRLQRLNRLTVVARRTMLALAVLVHHRATRPAAASEAEQAPARTALENAVGDALSGVANRIESGAELRLVDLRTRLVELGAHARDGEAALWEILVERVEALQGATGSA